MPAEAGTTPTQQGSSHTGALSKPPQPQMEQSTRSSSGPQWGSSVPNIDDVYKRPQQR